MEVTRDELERLIAEALLGDDTFRPKRRNWSETRSEDERRARIIAAAIVTFLDGCGRRWQKRPACLRTGRLGNEWAGPSYESDEETLAPRQAYKVC